MKREKQHMKSGFTLVELLVVLVILMVIGSIAVQNLGGEADKAKVKATIVSFTSLENALERFKIDCGRYPTADEGLYALMEAPDDLADEWAGKYLKKNSHLQDAWGKDYIYVVPGSNGDPFELISYGADFAEGGEKFDADLANTDD